MNHDFAFTRLRRIELCEWCIVGVVEQEPAGPVYGANATLTIDQQAYNVIHGALCCRGERANSLLKTTYKALRHYRGCPWRLGDIVGAALVLLHHENHMIHMG